MSTYASAIHAATILTADGRPAPRCNPRKQRSVLPPRLAQNDTEVTCGACRNLMLGKIRMSRSGQYFNTGVK